MKNVEIKARVSDLGVVKSKVEALGEAVYVASLRQTDTYFNVTHGRLKLREISGTESLSQLVYYMRPDVAGPKTSIYEITDVADSDGVKRILEGALGILAVVSKQRELFLWKNVRIHLDEVVELVAYVELEAVIDMDISELDGMNRIEELMDRLSLCPDDLVGCSYCDLLLQGSRGKTIS